MFLSRHHLAYKCLGLFFTLHHPLYKPVDCQLVYPSFAALLYEKMDLDGKPSYRHSKLDFSRFRKKPIGM
jgi:hypothetical protein